MCQANNSLLLATLFSCAQAALDQLGIALQEKNGSNRHEEEQDGHEDPSLPIPERTGGEEKKRSDENDSDEAAEDEPGRETTRSGHRLCRYWERQGESSRKQGFKFVVEFARVQLEMEDEAGAELKAVLARGIELGANVVGFDAKGDERFPGIVNTAAKLNGETVDARGCLRVNMDSAGQRVGPRLPCAPVPSDTRTRAVEQQTGGFVEKT